MFQDFQISNKMTNGILMDHQFQLYWNEMNWCVRNHGYRIQITVNSVLTLKSCQLIWFALWETWQRETGEHTMHIRRYNIICIYQIWEVHSKSITGIVNYPLSFNDKIQCCPEGNIIQCCFLLLAMLQLHKFEPLHDLFHICISRDMKCIRSGSKLESWSKCRCQKISNPADKILEVGI